MQERRERSYKEAEGDERPRQSLPKTEALEEDDRRARRILEARRSRIDHLKIDHLKVEVVHACSGDCS